jgi:hypothetical protein
MGAGGGGSATDTALGQWLVYIGLRQPGATDFTRVFFPSWFEKGLGRVGGGGATIGQKCNNNINNHIQLFVQRIFSLYYAANLFILFDFKGTTEGD